MSLALHLPEGTNSNRRELDRHIGGNSRRFGFVGRAAGIRTRDLCTHAGSALRVGLPGFEPGTS